MRLLYGVLGTAMLGLSACAELGIQSPDLRGSTAESTGPVLAEQALSNAGRFPEDVSDEVATPKPVPPLPARKPEATQAAIQALQRSEERRVGKEWVSPSRSRWSPSPYKTTQ